MLRKTDPDNDRGVSSVQAEHYFKLRGHDIYFALAFVSKDTTEEEIDGLFEEADRIPTYDYALERQQALIDTVKAAIENDDTLDDEDVWAPGAFVRKGLVLEYDGDLYECLQEHITQDTWNPPDAPALWKKLAPKTGGHPGWVQPTGAHDAYAKGAVVSYAGGLWISTAKDNVWAPGVYGWSEYTEDK
jgi:hypothetical protein